MADINNVDISVSIIKKMLESLKIAKDFFIKKGEDPTLTIDTASKAIEEEATKLRQTYTETFQLVLDLRKSNDALVKKNAALEKKLLSRTKKLEKIKKFNLNRDSYELVLLAYGSQAWRLKPGAQSDLDAPKPDEKLTEFLNHDTLFCPTCFNKNKISHLQLDKPDPATYQLICPKCQTLVYKPREPDRILSTPSSTHHSLKGYTL